MKELLSTIPVQEVAQTTNATGITTSRESS